MTKSARLLFCVANLFFGILIIAGHAVAQARPVERTFSNSVAQVQQAVDDLKSSSSGRLPILDGFVDVGDQPLKDYERGYYVCTLQVLPAASGGTTVRVTSKITAWFTDPESARSGYRELTSNGHVETDLLDRMEDALARNASGHAPATRIRTPAPGPLYAPKPSPQTPGVAATPAQPGSSASANGESSSNKDVLVAPAPAARSAKPRGTVPADPAPGESIESIQARRAIVEEKARQISADIKGLEEIQKNQVRPVDLVVVKKPGVAVYSKPEEGAQVLFSADQEDEFQIISLESSWVHVQISGASRGWIRRFQVELPAGYSPGGTQASSALPASANLFKVAREETNTFSGKWDPLQGKRVRIVWIEPIAGASSSAAEKRKYAKSLLLNAYNDMTSSGEKVAGVVIVFDSADGGQIAATMESLKALQDGSLSEAAFWKQCSLDPPEAFQPSTKS